MGSALSKLAFGSAILSCHAQITCITYLNGHICLSDRQQLQLNWESITAADKFSDLSSAHIQDLEVCLSQVMTGLDHSQCPA